MTQPTILTEENFEAEVIKSNIPVLVDFWAPWCGPCRMMIPVLDETAEKFAGKVKIAKLDVNEEKNQALAEKYQIQGIPALKIFKDGKVVKELVGYQPTETLASELNEFLA